MTYEAYDPIFDAETAGSFEDYILLSPKICKCGTVMENGFSDECAWCQEKEEDE